MENNCSPRPQKAIFLVSEEIFFLHRPQNAKNQLILGEKGASVHCFLCIDPADCESGSLAGYRRGIFSFCTPFPSAKAKKAGKIDIGVQESKNPANIPHTGDVRLTNKVKGELLPSF